MTTSQSNLLELAKQGDAKAIAALMNRYLQPKGITAKASLKDGCLQVVLESAQVPEQKVLAAFIQKGILALKIPAIRQVRLYGQCKGEDFPSWDQILEISPTQPETTAEHTKPAPRSIELQKKEVTQTINVTSKKPPSIVNRLTLLKPKVAGRILASSVIACVGFSAIGFIFWNRSEQAKVISNAHTILANSKASETSLDEKALEESQKQLKLAISLLEKVSNIPGSLYSSAQVEKANARSQLETLEQRIKTTEQLRVQAKTVLDKFTALNSRLNIGMNYQKYGDEVSELKVILDQFLQQPDATQLPFTSELTDALNDYSFAHDVWKYYIESDKTHKFFPASSIYGEKLVREYQVRVDNIMGTDYIYLNFALSAVWNKAKAHIKTAQS